MSHLPINETDLQAWVDAALPEARRAEVEVYLAGHPEDFERVQAYQAQKKALRAMFNPVLDEPLPDSLRAAAAPPVTTAAARWSSRLAGWPAWRLAAGLLLALLGGATGWLARGQYPGGDELARVVPLYRQAAVAHAVFSPDVRRPVEVGAEQEAQLVAWLSKRLGTAVKPPKLGELGFELIGGRLLPGNSGPVAQFMYQDVAGQRLTLYVTTENPGNQETGFRFAQEGPVNVFYWIDGKFGYALSGSIGKGELGRLATLVYDQLERK
ncbi:MAG: PrtR transrane transcriptional regulator (anti-sigma factor) [Proteobacteria bacterium]|nr:PrtR transrane transcriptional regulator (anti-sigma factor) [Pseudomonadota bacterium]